MSEKFTVLDKFAEELDRPREHELINPDSQKVQRFVFKPKEALTVDRWAALKFAAIDGFDVRDEAGNPYKVKTATTTLTRTLAADEVVARLDELTQDALLSRCVGGGFNKASKKGDMIAWLLRAGVAEEGEDLAEIDEAA